MEVIVVVIVTGILIGLTSVIYNVVQSNAIESSMKTDLSVAVHVLEKDRSTSGDYPLTPDHANGGDGFDTSPGNVLVYSSNYDTFCISVSNPSITKTLYYTPENRVIQTGDCSGHVSAQGVGE